MDQMGFGYPERNTIRMLEEADSITYEMNDNETLVDNVNDFLLPRNISITDEYIFDRTDMRVIFITLYSIVFVCCFFGNLMVILVVTFSRRLRSITNFFLGNLAVADLCVGIFCVYQTLVNYMMKNWQLGNFICKAYMFVYALSYTASILILVLVCIERYLAIVHPMKCKSLLTKRRLTAVVIVVWIASAAYASPRFFYVEAIVNTLNSTDNSSSPDDMDIICTPTIKRHDRKILNALNLFFLYLLPLCLMGYLYARIGVDLWKSNATLEGPGLMANTRNGKIHHVHTSSRNVVRARRGVIRMLIVVVMMFAVCNFPQQARILWHDWGSRYDPTSNFTSLLTVSTFLISYMNSCLNPLLYAFLSRNFRRGMKELLICKGTRVHRDGLAMVCASGSAGRHENGVGINLPHSSVVRLSSLQDSPCTTQTITRRSTYRKHT